MRIGAIIGDGPSDGGVDWRGRPARPRGDAGRADMWRGHLVSPTDGPDGPAPRESRPAAARRPRAIRVLLVDDHRLLLESLARVLAPGAGHPDRRDRHHRRRGRDARQEPLDVVLMDYRLPDGTGVEATRAIKARWPSCADRDAHGHRRRRDASSSPSRPAPTAT